MFPFRGILLHPFFGKFGWSKMKMVRLRRGRLGVAPPRMSFYASLYAVKKLAPIGDQEKKGVLFGIKSQLRQYYDNSLHQIIQAPELKKIG